MGYSRQQKQENHARIVAIAARRFRELGLDGLGVAGLMKEAGLTHGGFYAHFASRDALVAEALDCAFREDEARLKRGMARREGPMLARFLDTYLSPAHRDNPGQGCTLAAVAPEAARRDEAVKALFDRQVEAYTALLADEAGLTRAQAMAAISASMGALSLSRTVADRALSDEILAAAKQSLNGLAAGRP